MGERASRAPQLVSSPDRSRGRGRTTTRRRFIKQLGLSLAAGGAAWSAAALGSNASEARTALQAIPLDEIQDPVRSQLLRVVQNPSLYRRLPVSAVQCDPSLYLFLIRYPEVVVNMWQLMGVTKVDVQRVNDYKVNAKDGAGTVSEIELVYGTPTTHVMLADGYYEGPLIKRRLTGRCVMILNTDYKKADEQAEVSSQLDIFVQLDNVGAELIAKTLHPLFGRTADSNFVQSTQFLGQVSRVAENNGVGLQRLARKLTKVDPTVRMKFAEIAGHVNRNAILRSVRKTEGNSPGESGFGSISDNQSVR